MFTGARLRNGGDRMSKACGEPLALLTCGHALRPSDWRHFEERPRVGLGLQGWDGRRISVLASVKKPQGYYYAISFGDRM